MNVELIDHMGNDLTTVNSARVSFDKRVSTITDRDIKLIGYLASHNHWTPFSHIMVTMRETVPIFVARQRFKHTVGFTYNEVSRRYVDDAPKFYVPDVWRKAAENKKQGSSDEAITEIGLGLGTALISNQYRMHLEKSQTLYDDLIRSGVAPEQARMVLPQSMYTSYYVTGSLAAWARAYKLRSEEHAQKEIANLANMWYNIIYDIEEVRHSWKALST